MSSNPALGADIAVKPGEYLFSYGTLQQDAVQMAAFGRRLTGDSDALRGFAVVPLPIDDPDVVALSGSAQHTMARFTGRDSDVVRGKVFEVTPDEVRQADRYEVPAVKRIEVVLQSGRRAWVYVDARDDASARSADATAAAEGVDFQTPGAAST